MKVDDHPPMLRVLSSLHEDVQLCPLARIGYAERTQPLNSPGMSPKYPAALQEVGSRAHPDEISDLEASKRDLPEDIAGIWGNDQLKDCLPERLLPEGAAITWDNKLLSELLALSKVVENADKAGEYLERVVARRIEQAGEDLVDMTGAPDTHIILDDVDVALAVAFRSLNEGDQSKALKDQLDRSELPLDTQNVITHSSYSI